MLLLADLHIHTVASGHAYSTVQEIASAASERGLELLALTDHGPAMPGGAHEYYFGNLRVLPECLYGVEILHGVEANIMDVQGKLDLPEVYLQRLDIVLAGLHVPCLPPADRDRNTQALVNALRNPYVDIIVHPGNPDFPIDFAVVAQVAAAEGKALELNNSSFLVRQGSWEYCAEVARFAQRFGALVSLGSDAHFSADVGKFGRAIKLALEAGISPEQVLNTSAERVINFLTARGKKRFC
ncbi:MAG: phosphatase [Dethiobacter sp.]|nr:phosphatase [Dethiobacter sp.]